MCSLIASASARVLTNSSTSTLHRQPTGAPDVCEPLCNSASLAKHNSHSASPLRQLPLIITARPAFAHEPAHHTVSPPDPILEFELGGCGHRTCPNSKRRADVVRMECRFPTISVNRLTPLSVAEHGGYEAGQRTERKRVLPSTSPVSVIEHSQADLVQSANAKTNTEFSWAATVAR